MYYFSGLAGMVFLAGDTALERLPRDAVSVSESEYDALQKQLSQGNELSMDDNARPIAVPQQVIPPIELAQVARDERNALLRNTDWVVLRSSETGRPVPKEVIKYRQALRDIPTQKGYPNEIEWPKPPPF